MFCYVGKATKIFLFIVAVIVVTGLIVGFGFLRHNSHPKSHQCSGEDCSLSDYSPPLAPPLQISFPSLPDPSASNPSDSTANSNTPPPPSLETTLPPPLTNPSPPSPFPPPPPLTVVAPPAAFTAAPPQGVQVSPGPMNSS